MRLYRFYIHDERFRKHLDQYNRFDLARSLWSGLDYDYRYDGHILKAKEYFVGYEELLLGQSDVYYTFVFGLIPEDDYILLSLADVIFLPFKLNLLPYIESNY